MWKKGIFILSVALVGLAAVLVVRTYRYTPHREAVAAVHGPAVDGEAAALRLGGAVAFPTVSHQVAERIDSAAFRGLQAYLAETFPRVQTALRRELVSDLSLLYTWPGSDTTLAPVLLLSHLDVVPVEAGTETDWVRPPFSGEVSDGFVWGRGTLDDKVGVMGLLEAVELSLAEGFVPTRTIYLAFGHDEEVGGRQGAVQMAARLAARGVQPAFVLDEGGAVMEGVLPGLTQPVALIGIAEKGYMSVRLTVEGEGGHSSMPPPQTPVGILGAAVARLEAHPMPARFDGAVARMFDDLGPEMAFRERMVFANLWLFRPFITMLLDDVPASNALIRTTTAPTMLSGSAKENVLPARATAVVNFRILPGETVDGVLEHVHDAIDDARVQVDVLPGAGDPSPVSAVDGFGFPVLARTVRETYPRDDLLVAPFLVVGATDARHYTGLSDEVFRFAPFTLRGDDRARFHGTNERIAVADYATVVRFYHRLFRNAAG